MASVVTALITRAASSIPARSTPPHYRSSEHPRSIAAFQRPGSSIVR